MSEARKGDLGAKMDTLDQRSAPRNAALSQRPLKKKPLLHPPREQSIAAMYVVGFMSSLPAHRHEPELKYKLSKAKPPIGIRGECQIHLPDLKRLRNKKALFIPSSIHSFSKHLLSDFPEPFYNAY